ncbi:putative 50S ribosomal protein L27 [Trichinella spiralis]|uniref:putative 50S ribosomal protein L27 n=1 Tax=Trichinella spiralis TaxID=6334 RepID=UPI0001EFBD90|nr:putative 50S ribosomal protein L27 [Trichinella spiralis]
MGQVNHVLPEGPFLPSSSSAYPPSRQAQMTPAYPCSFSGTRFNRRFNALSLLNATSMLSGRGNESSLQRILTEYLNPSQRILQIISSLDHPFSRRRSVGSSAVACLQSASGGSRASHHAVSSAVQLRRARTTLIQPGSTAGISMTLHEVLQSVKSILEWRTNRHTFNCLQRRTRQTSSQIVELCDVA